MSPTPECKRCDAPLAADAPEGLCPRCLIALNLAPHTEVPDETDPQRTKVVKPPPPAPAQIAKHFPQLEILECMGRGGMGVVYKARQLRLGRLVALKILAPEKDKDPAFAVRFAREAQALARLSHPAIVTVHDFGEADGLYYLLMEFVDGVNLRDLLQGGKMAPEKALAVVPKICDALQYAHNQGIVHRDIKPENILLDQQGRVKIADFGIARILGPSGDATLTGAKDVVGTPYYMAPEQVEKPATVDHRADIYSLGVVFYEMLTGELPLGKFAPPSRKVQVDVRLDEVVLHALEKEPERRYQQASEVKSDVETITSTSIAQATPTASPKKKMGALGLAPEARPFDSVRLSPARAAASVGFSIFLVIFLAAEAVALFLPKADAGRNLGIGLLLGIVNGVMAGLLMFVGFSATKSGLRPTSGGVGKVAAIIAAAIMLLLSVPVTTFFLTSTRTRTAPPAFGQGTEMSLNSLGDNDSGGRNTDTLTLQGWQLIQGGRALEAIPKFEAAIKLEPEHTNAWNGLGWAQFNSGKAAAADKSFRKTLELEPNHPAALNGLGQVYLSQKKYDEAELYLLKASPKAPAAWYGLARLYLLQDKFDQAETWAQKLVDSGQADAGARRMLQAARDRKLSDGLRLMLEP